MIFKATLSHLMEVIFIYDSCVFDMNTRGLFNWNTAYPSWETVYKDIEEGNLFIYQENQIVAGVFCLNEEQPVEYESLDWKYEGPFLVVHRLAVHPVYRNKGIAEKMMLFAEKYALNNKYKVIRLDAITSNPQAMKVYEKTGYLKTGLINFEYQKVAFQCMEKKPGSNK